MDLKFNLKISNDYASKSQIIRVLSEEWVEREAYCPNCGSSLFNYENNKPVADFYCRQCLEDYELKSKSGKFNKKISAGAYSKILEKVSTTKKPHFLFMAYKDDLWFVKDFFVVPKYFFVPEIIEKRKPLAKKAKRAGWVGSNILFFKIPNAGKVYIVENGTVIKKEEVLVKWKKTAFLKQINKADAKGWILDIMNCIDSLNKQEFTLQEIYMFEDALSAIHPENKHIRDKIRQQLQILRKMGYLEFTAPGKYRLI